MKVVEISGKFGNDLKRYNAITDVSIAKQPFTKRTSVLYGYTKPTDIVQTNEPTNILIDVNNNPIGKSEPVYFGIRVYPFISRLQDFTCNNNIITYVNVLSGYKIGYFENISDFKNLTLLPKGYIGEMNPQPRFVESLPNDEYFLVNHWQAMQQFVNDCVFPTKPNLELPGQSQSATYSGNNNLPYFSPKVYHFSNNNHTEPQGILCLIQQTSESKPTEYKNYMVQFDGIDFNFKFGMAVNEDFSVAPQIYLPYLYRTYVALPNLEPTGGLFMGVIMQAMLYDSNGNVISA